jgi:hypothetical protein
MTLPPSPEPSPALIQAVTTLLRPLVRLLLRFQVTYPYLCQLLKALYVEVASREPGDARLTDSRITMITGIHRKDIRRFREEGLQELRPPATLPLSAQIVAAWLSLPEFTTPDGKPRPLPRTAGDHGDTPGFDTLVDRVARQDLRARSVLDEWLRLGLVHIDAQQCVVLNTEAFIPEKGFEEKLYYFGKNLHDHLSAGCHNLLGEGSPQFDRSVYYNNLSPAAIDELTRLVSERGMQTLKDINRRARELQQADSGRADAHGRFNFGMYYFLDSETPAAPQNAPDDKEHEHAAP